MSSNVLHVHVTEIASAVGELVVQPVLSIRVGSGSTEIITDTLSPTISLKVLGIYRTSIQLNKKIMDTVKSYLEDAYSIDPDDYAAEYLSGAYGLLNLL